MSCKTVAEISFLLKHLGAHPELQQGQKICNSVV